MNIGSYAPKRFAVKFVEINGSTQYPMFCATALGSKLCYDDWIQSERYPEYEAFCRELGLHCLPDVMFCEPPRRETIAGRQNITTTFAKGMPYSPDRKGEVHVFVSRSLEAVHDIKKSGWYPIVIENRIVAKPFVDNLWFGRMLNYPQCCIDFFRLYNNWQVYSHPYEVFKNSPKNGLVCRGSYLCNNFLMDNTFFLIHHIPCSYECPETKALAKRVQDCLHTAEPEFVEKTVELLKSPLLVFGERHFVLFKGKAVSDGIEYSDHQYFWNVTRPEDRIGFIDRFGEGDAVRIINGNLELSKAGRRVGSIRAKDWFFIDFK